MFKKFAFMESTSVGGMPFLIDIGRRYLPKNKKKRETLFRISMIVLTYVIYALFNMARRPIAVVNSKILEECKNITGNDTSDDWCENTFFEANIKEFLGFIDSVYIASYGVSLYISGIIADCYNPRYYLTFGCLMSGFFCALLGLSDYWEIRSFKFFTMALILFGFSQSTGWPVALSCVTHWYSGARRGMFFGFWNTHNYIGSILGIYIAAKWVDWHWGVSFFIPGAIIAALGIIVYLAMVADPNDLKELEEVKRNVSMIMLRKQKVEAPNWLSSAKSITMYDALQLPGVIEFSACMFFSRMVGYIFLFWLPTFIKEAENISASVASYFSIAYVLGGSLGGIVAGMIVDAFRRSALVCAIFLLISIPVLMLMLVVGMGANMYVELPIYILIGLFVEAPYIVTSTSVSADLGTHKMIKRNHRAISTIGGIMEGTGAIGAAIGTYLCGVASVRMNFSYIVYMMMILQFVATLCLSRQAYKDYFKKEDGRSFQKYLATPVL